MRNIERALENSRLSSLVYNVEPTHGCPVQSITWNQHTVVQLSLQRGTKHLKVSKT